jgi:hypothetical protein
MATACAGTTAGKPRATPTGSHSQEPTRESTSETEEPAYSLARLCELISADEAEHLGASSEGEKGNSVSDGHEICSWSEATNLVVGYQDGLTTANVRTGDGVTNTPTKIDELTAVLSLQTQPSELCQVLVDLPSGKLLSSSVAILSAGEGKYDACQVATDLANLIIPRVKDQ